MTTSNEALRYAYENRLRRYYNELVRRQRYGLPTTPSAKQLDNFIAELRSLCAEEADRRMVKAA